jgi:hypothetical protein
MKTDKIVTMLIVAGGGYALYWYLSNYGPNGPIATAGGVSYWTTWFGAAAAPVTTQQTQSTPVTGPVNTISTVPIQTQATSTQTQPTQTQTVPVQTQSTPAPTPSTSVNIPANLTVTPDINNSITGQIIVNGASKQITIIPTQLGATTGNAGLIWDSNGQDITSQFTANQQQVLTQAYQAALVNYNIGPLSAIPGLNLQPVSVPSGAVSGLRRRNGMGIIMPLSPYITPATNGVRDPMSLTAFGPAAVVNVAGMSGLSAIPRGARRGWGKLPSGGVGGNGWIH